MGAVNIAIAALLGVLVTVISSIALLVLRRWVLVRRRERMSLKAKHVTVFHPYCDAGGGGERVLWFAILAILQLHPEVKITIAARKSTRPKDAVLKMARERFGVQGLDEARIAFVSLTSQRFLEADTFPRLTLLGQSLGSIIVGAEALWRVGHTDMFLDTMGYAFTYPLAWLTGATVACYTHYPTISTDMLERVIERRPAYNNDELVSGSLMNSRLKFYYYLMFCKVYALVGKFTQCVIVNSSWTGGHINQLWSVESRVIFPPCDTKEFVQAQSEQRQRVIVSLGQFRPEKDHRLQILAMAELLKCLTTGDATVDLPELHMYGSCRDAEDEARIEELREFSKLHGVANVVKFKVNVPFPQLKQALGTALLGIHTMWNEHFGIAPVEMIAAGVILIAHDSGGPKMDIIEDGETGYLANSAQTYGKVLRDVLSVYDSGDPDNRLQSMRKAATCSMDRFAQENFVAQFSEVIAPLICGEVHAKSN